MHSYAITQGIVIRQGNFENSPSEMMLRRSNKGLGDVVAGGFDKVGDYSAFTDLDQHTHRHAGEWDEGARTPKR